MEHSVAVDEMAKTMTQRWVARVCQFMCVR